MPAAEAAHSDERDPEQETVCRQSACRVRFKGAEFGLGLYHSLGIIMSSSSEDLYRNC